MRFRVRVPWLTVYCLECMVLNSRVYDYGIEFKKVQLRAWLIVYDSVFTIHNLRCRVYNVGFGVHSLGFGV